MTTRVVAALVSASFSVSVFAQGFERTPLPETHPLVGTWRIDLPDQKCFEEYVVHTDGTKSSQSADERNESEVMISLVPSTSGFYKWTDRIIKNNGKADCSGSNTALGHVAVNFVRVHPSGKRFLLCEAEDMKSCYAEFYRKSK
ncbi:hypothetical protein [Caenimonas soli]|uniref:hypothetical protein n=1 Tax=Caenimonas soli TaxID=2735555 RepID=UPI001554513F|nr:hypothetical protein [Caenimonas soli]NPC59399.1 hypothetical protein [Caenimonas soli]